MKRVTREEVLSRQDYEKKRDEFRKRVIAQKELRRVHLGEHLTFLFETHDTVLYQVQEMMRAESMDGEPEIRHEIETYNELIGEKGELGCTLLIEIDDPAKRADLLTRWKKLPDHLYLLTEQGKRVPALFDSRQVGETRISSVHYLKFRVGDQIPKALGCSHPELKLEAALKPEQKAALARDLIGG